MRPGARREYVRRLRDMANGLRETADKMEASELPDLRRVGVGWGKNGCEIDIAGTYVFRMPQDERFLVSIIRAIAWGLFEARRSGSDPNDPRALAEVRSILAAAVPDVFRPPTACMKCGGMQRICVACNSDCKVSYSDPRQEAHDRTTTLCPDCSPWLAPQEPR